MHLFCKLIIIVLEPILDYLTSVQPAASIINAQPVSYMLYITDNVGKIDAEWVIIHGLYASPIYSMHV